MLSETKANKTKEAFPIESTDIGSYIVDIGLGVEESTLEGPPYKKKNKAKEQNGLQVSPRLKIFSQPGALGCRSRVP